MYLSNEINGRNKVINFIFGTLSNRIFYRLINDGQIIIGKVFVLVLVHAASPSPLSIYWMVVVFNQKRNSLESRFLAIRKTNYFLFIFVPCKSEAKSKNSNIKTMSRNEDITSSKNKRRRIYLIEMEHFYTYSDSIHV